MDERFSRTERLIGAQALAKLNNAHVAVFGLGGVGGYAVEALARGGIGQITLVDNDTVALSNVNRQIIATEATLGQKKTDAMKERIRLIHPNLIVHTVDMFLLPENANEIDFEAFDYIVDAVDTVAAKLTLVKCAADSHTPVISCMGAGNKLCATAFTVSNIKDTSMCPLARVMRKELKKRFGIENAKVVYSMEKALKPEGDERLPGSISYVPGVAGLIAAGEVIKDIIYDTGITPY